MASRAKQLGKALGGKWTYDGRCSWWCDDKKRHVVRTSLGVDQFDDPLPGCAYYLYGDGSPRRAEAYMQSGGTSLGLFQ